MQHCASLAPHRKQWRLVGDKNSARARSPARAKVPVGPRQRRASSPKTSKKPSESCSRRSAFPCSSRPRPAAAARACAWPANDLALLKTAPLASRRRPRRKRRSAMPASIIEKLRGAATARRNPDPCRPARATCFTCGNATAPRSGATKNSSKNRPSPRLPQPPTRLAMCRCSGASGPRSRLLLNAGTVEFIVDQDTTIFTSSR